MTPAKELGLVVGNTYTYDHHGESIEVVFKEDDGSDYPAFYCPEDYDRDGWAFMCLENIAIAEVKDTVRTFLLSVGANETSISIGRALTTAEVIEVLKIIEGK